MSKILNKKEDGFIMLVPGIKAPFFIVDDKDFVVLVELKNKKNLTHATNKDYVRYEDGICVDDDISKAILYGLLKEFTKL